MMAFQNGFEYRNSDLQVLKCNIFATFCASLIAIGSQPQRLAYADETQREERRELPGERDNAKCMQGRKTMHSLNEQHQAN